MREKRKGFSTSAHRFDKKDDFKRFFDSTPGPGSYNLAQELQNKFDEMQPGMSAVFINI